MRRYPPSENADEILTYLAALNNDELAALNKVYLFWRRREFLMTIGGVSLVLGGALLLVGLASSFALVFGIIFIMIGVWALRTQSLRALLAIGAIIVLFALLILVVGFTAGPCTCATADPSGGGSTSEGSLAVFAFVIGVPLLLIGAAVLIYYVRNANAYRDRPSQATLTRYSYIWEQLARTRAVHNDQRIEFKIFAIRWVGFMFGDHVVFTPTTRKQLYLFDKAEFEFTPIRSREGKAHISGRVYLGKLRPLASMPREVYENLQRWKTPTPVA